ncbi:MAG: MFS transporter [Candidatus Abyssubacteria bacterium]|nr:MFS transporter [Candidatus Abyssubacteria bacterium]
MKSRIISVIFIVIAVTMIGVGIIAPLMPVYAQQMGATGMELGVIFAAFAATRMIFTPIVGRISDRFGRKWFLLCGLLAFTLLSLGYVASQTVLHLTLMRLAHGATSALVIPIAFAYIGDITPEQEEGKYMSIVNLAIFVGMGIGPFLGGHLADAYGIRSAFWALFGFGTIASLLVIFLLPDIHARKSEFSGHLPPLRGILSDPLVGGLLTIRAGSAVRRAVVMAFLPVFADYIGLKSTHMGTMISAFIIAAALMQYPAGILADKYDRIRIVVLGEILATICFAFFPLVKSFPQLLAVGLAAGTAGGLAMPSILAINTEVGRKYGMAWMMGLFDAAMGFGMLFGALTAGAVMDAMGIRTVFYYGVFMGVAAIVAFAVLARRQHRRSI